MPAGRRAGRSGSGTAGGSVATHEAAANPHPTYATDTDLSTHEADTTSIHGITDTAQLAKKNVAQTFTEDQTIESDNKLLFGADTNLYRSAADTLKTDDNLNVATDLIVRQGASQQVAIGNWGTGSTPGLLLWVDTVLYRAAADVLATDDAMQFLELGADAAAGASNTARLYARDNGSGKTQLVVRFPTGAVQVLATEP